MKAWRFYGFGDMRLDEVPEPVCGPGQVLVEPLCVQPSVTEAQLAQGIPTLAFDRVKRRLETEAPVQLFGHEFCARVLEAYGRGDVKALADMARSGADVNEPPAAVALLAHNVLALLCRCVEQAHCADGGPAPDV